MVRTRNGHVPGTMSAATGRSDFGHAGLPTHGQCGGWLCQGKFEAPSTFHWNKARPPLATAGSACGLVMLEQVVTAGPFRGPGLVIAPLVV